MAVSKKVACVNEECALYDVVYEIPYSMLQSIDEPIHCGTCHDEAPEIQVEARANVEPINASQVANIELLNRTTFFGSAESLPTS